MARHGSMRAWLFARLRGLWGVCIMCVKSVVTPARMAALNGLPASTKCSGCANTIGMQGCARRRVHYAGTVSACTRLRMSHKYQKYAI